MKAAFVGTTCAIAMVAALGLTCVSALAIPVTYAGSKTDGSSQTTFAPSVTFDTSGNGVVVTLVRTSPKGERTKSDVLTAVFTDLPGNPAAASVGAHESAYEGHHEGASCDRISGWVWDPQQPDAPIVVSLYADETLLATLTANQFRQDLLDAGKGNGYHAFSSPLPSKFRDGKPHRIRVKAENRFDLLSTPQLLNCAPDSGSK